MKLYRVHALTFHYLVSVRKLDVCPNKIQFCQMRNIAPIYVAGQMEVVGFDNGHVDYQVYV